ncbi:MAG: hypothetical protein ACLPUO_29460 [Streptosporangiaceae bacterium]
MLELDEDEGGLGDVADLSGAEHDALESAPALGHQGEASSRIFLTTGAAVTTTAQPAGLSRPVRIVGAWRKVTLTRNSVFPRGVFAAGGFEPVRDFEASKGGRFVQSKDKATGSANGFLRSCAAAHFLVQGRS